MDLTAPAWFYDVGQTLLKLLPGGLLTVWCLWAVNWRRTWPVLAAGGWVPLVLIGLMAAYVWSLVWPTNALVLGLFVAFGDVARGMHADRSCGLAELLERFLEELGEGGEAGGGPADDREHEREAVAGGAND